MIIGTVIASYTGDGEGEREALAMVQKMLHGLNQATANLDFFGDDNRTAMSCQSSSSRSQSTPR